MRAKLPHTEESVHNNEFEIQYAPGTTASEELTFVAFDGEFSGFSTARFTVRQRASGSRAVKKFCGWM